ncbi:hypothetical protein MUK42_27713 [Musa troglodytarum]|uniref:Uncharacterized protein n=1 Tax=Musa troglodytarum TaxID=320322 RepID=A0A9E7FSP4_9LILI|nr:hypothetical protein MUK42_27713 [Musa troglodytarum]
MRKTRIEISGYLLSQINFKEGPFRLRFRSIVVVRSLRCDLQTALVILEASLISKLCSISILNNIEEIRNKKEELPIPATQRSACSPHKYLFEVETSSRRDLQVIMRAEMRASVKETMICLSFVTEQSPRHDLCTDHKSLSTVYCTQKLAVFRGELTNNIGSSRSGRCFHAETKADSSRLRRGGVILGQLSSVEASASDSGRRIRKKFVFLCSPAGIEAPRNSLEFPMKIYQSFQVVHKEILHGNDTNKLIAEEIPQITKDRCNRPSVVAQLMDALPSDVKPLLHAEQLNDEKGPRKEPSTTNQQRPHLP